jgi:omega-amidase
MSTNSTLTVSIVQANLVWQNKSANLQQFEKQICERQQHTEIVLLPEMFSTGFSMQAKELAENMDGVTIGWMRKLAIQEKIIIAGSLIIDEQQQYYNRFIWMLPNGEMTYYDKRHLFGFAEEDKYFAAGNKRCIVQVKGWKILLQVCYDLRFPVWARQQVLNGVPEYDAIFYVANWPERRSHAWKTLLCARAIENQAAVIGVNRVGEDGNGIYHSGNSMVINSLGEVLYHKADEEDFFTISLQKKTIEQTRQKLPFLKDADEFKILS